jgi:DNA-binding HxlR family transcriptional regulator/putative sterol carrier protein
MRSYQQFCPAARALDIVGERWTLLVIRELLTGPKRYTDLQGGLPGIGPNVLAARLRSLEQAGIVEKRRLPPPAASTVYALTVRGAGLRPVLTSLFDWGLGLADAPGKNDAVKASYWLPAIEQAIHPQALSDDVDDTYEIRVGEESIVVTVSRGSARVTAGSAESPDLILSTDHRTFADLGRGALTALEAIEQRRLTVEGDPAAAERCAAVFGAGASAGAGAGT